jgi:hypothetical protein
MERVNRGGTAAAAAATTVSADGTPLDDRATGAPGAGAPGAGAPGVGTPGSRQRGIHWPWLISRLVAVLILIPENDMLRDVMYYGLQLRELAGPAGLRDVLREYPAPSLLVSGPVWWAAHGNWYAYLAAFVVLMLALDAAFTVALWRAAGRRLGPGPWLWILVVPVLGPIVYARFDLVPAVLAGGALLALAGRRPATAGVLTGAGAAVKLWPVALVPALLLDRAGRLRALAGFLGIGAVAVAGTVATGGFERLLSPLTWQGERGLQIESLFAVPLLCARLVSPSTWATPYTRFYAFQVEGPGAATLADLSTVTTVLALGLLGWLCWRVLRWRQRPDDVRAVAGLLMTGTACLLVITNRTLSPQYLIWVGALLAALGCVAPAEPTLPRLVRLLLVSCGLTQVIYPIGYALLTNETWATWIGVALLTARNALLVAITVIAMRRVFALTRPLPPGDQGEIVAR